MIERKCTSCKTWNKDEDYCTNCGASLSPKAIDKQKAQKRKEEEAKLVPSKLDVRLEKMKNSKNLFVRGTYQIIHGVTIIMAAFGAFLAWLVAMANA